MIINDPNENKLKRIVTELEKRQASGNPIFQKTGHTYRWTDDEEASWYDTMEHRGASQEGLIDSLITAMNEENLQRAVSQGGGFNMPLLKALLGLGQRATSPLMDALKGIFAKPKRSPLKYQEVPRNPDGSIRG